jgi:phage terminase large subunit-like protein
MTQALEAPAKDPAPDFVTEIAFDRWDTSCPDWEERIVAGRPLIPDLPLFASEADRALRVFKRLRVPDIVGTPTYGEVCGQWTFDLVRALFGAFDPATRRRMIREFFVLLPKKNGKSSIAAAIMVTAAIVNRRPAAELLLIAPTKKIADIAYKQAAGIIKLDPELTKIFHTKGHERTIQHRLTDAVILIKAADADVITGSKATYILVDETHVFALKANAADIFVEIRGSLASRPDGFLLQITTQSKAPPAGVFKSELNIARDVRDGLVKLPLLAVLYELPRAMAESGQWKDPSTWRLVNPNLNRSVDEAYLRDELLKAEREGAGQVALIASQHFNVEINQALQSDRWRGADYWQAAADKSLRDLKHLIERSEVITVGLDGGGLDDLFGMAVIGRCKETRRWLLWNRAWVKDDVLKLRKEIASNLRDYEKDGDLVIVPNLTRAFAECVEIIVMLREAGMLPAEGAVGVDPQAIASLVDALAEENIVHPQVVAVPQGYKLSSAIWGTEVKLSEGTLSHADQPLMTFCVGNARVEQRGSAILITKQAAGKAKIDPLSATFDAAEMMSRNPAGNQKKYQMIIV